MKSTSAASFKLAVLALVLFLINCASAKPGVSSFDNPNYSDDTTPRTSEEYYEEPTDETEASTASIQATSPLPPPVLRTDSQPPPTDYDPDDSSPGVPGASTTKATDAPPLEVPQTSAAASTTEAADAPPLEVTQTSAAPQVTVTSSYPHFSYVCPEPVAYTEFYVDTTHAPTTPASSTTISSEPAPPTEPSMKLAISNSSEEIKTHLEGKFHEEYPTCNPSQDSRDLFNTTRLDSLLTKIQLLHNYTDVPLAVAYEALLETILYSPHVCAQDYVRLASIVHKKYVVATQTNGSQEGALEDWNLLRERFSPAIWDLFEASKKWKIVPVERPSAALLVANISCPAGEGFTLIKNVEGSEDNSAKWHLIPSATGSYFQVRNAKFGVFFKGTYSQMHGNKFSQLMLVPSQEFVRNSEQDRNGSLEFYVVRTDQRATVGVESWVKLNTTVVGEQAWALKRNHDTYQDAALFKLEH